MKEGVAIVLVIFAFPVLGAVLTNGTEGDSFIGGYLTGLLVAVGWSLLHDTGFFKKK